MRVVLHIHNTIIIISTYMYSTIINLQKVTNTLYIICKYKRPRTSNAGRVSKRFD